MCFKRTMLSRNRKEKTQKSCYHRSISKKDKIIAKNPIQCGCIFGGIKLHNIKR